MLDGVFEVKQVQYTLCAAAPLLRAAGKDMALSTKRGFRDSLSCPGEGMESGAIAGPGDVTSGMFPTSGLHKYYRCVRPAPAMVC